MRNGSTILVDWRQHVSCFHSSLNLCMPQARKVPAYRNPALPVEQRVADLLSRMTLEEKVAQLQGNWQNPASRQDPSQTFLGDKGVFLPERAAIVLKQGLGGISRPSENRSPREMAEFTNTVQKWMKENTRLGNSDPFSRRMPARPCGAQGNFVSATDCAGLQLGPCPRARCIFRNRG